MKIKNGDKVRVEAWVEAEDVEVEVYAREQGFHSWLYMDAAKARKLARKLLAAADEIDPQAARREPTVGELGLCGPVICDGGAPLPIVAAAVAVEERAAAPRGFQVGDRVVVQPGARSRLAGGHAVDAMAGVATVVALGGWAGCHQPADELLVEYRGGSRQSVDPQYVRPYVDDAPDVDPAEPRGCCGGGC